MSAGRQPSAFIHQRDYGKGRNPLGALLSRSRRARQRKVVQDYSARPETVKVKTVVVFGAGAVSTTPSALMLL